MGNLQEMETTIKAMAIAGKGVLAADESTSTIEKRLKSINVACTEENRRAYRELLFTAPGLGDYISGVIMYDETIRQSTKAGKPFSKALAQQKIVPGIKVDKGLVPLPGSEEENITQGLDGLADRLKEYKLLGARFAKWRALLVISEQYPSMFAIRSNAQALARYAAICQQQGIIPIVEPELLMDGDHSIARCAFATERTLATVFQELRHHRVLLELMILKPSMVIAGKDCPEQAKPEQVAKETVKILRRTVPAAVPTINFLSGGQSDEAATEHLNFINKLGLQPWVLSFSYGRALQASALKAWGGDPNKISIAQQALLKRA